MRRIDMNKVQFICEAVAKTVAMITSKFAYLITHTFIKLILCIIAFLLEFVNDICDDCKDAVKKTKEYFNEEKDELV